MDILIAEELPHFFRNPFGAFPALRAYVLQEAGNESYRSTSKTDSLELQGEQTPLLQLPGG